MAISKTGPPTAKVVDLPQELLDRICSYEDIATLKALRLAGKVSQTAPRTSLSTLIMVS